MVFEFSDGFDSTKARTPAVINKAHAALDALPDGKMIKLDELSAKCSVVESTLAAYTVRWFEEYRINTRGRTYYYGNKQSVAAWNAQQETV